ncbi:carbohydrate-binding family 9-like protein [Pseudozobellia thermophila]|uniref:Carbohydrate family 9 binding domain-like n=1 Tax=Pseudozobellia thermophila TaxID=192903 RepID=A0A1M6HK13_9FLAO|nr:carbohydrate-binding family 9-like protein [Pseudozobellia thermophila]SHJ22543.1 Carbohydrate family 9 binding domain-like [Pseudozobellia thermophila]
MLAKTVFIKNRRQGMLLLAFLLFVSFGAAQSAPRTYAVQRTIDTIRVDGLDREASWRKATWSADYIDIEGDKVPKYRTRMKMLYDDVYLYFFAQMEEPHVWGDLQQRDTVIFYNNDFEIFIDPDGDTHNYYEFEMNALNTVWDLFLTKPYRNHGKVIDSWDIQGLKTAVHIDGTLNSPDDTDKGWSVEIAIPWKVITEASNANRLPKNEFWRINFSRVNWDYELKNGKYARKRDEHGKFLPEYNWVWSPQGVINMHEPEHWGYLYVSDTKVGEKVDFVIPKDEYIKWHLYAQYRRLLHAGDAFKKVKNEIDGAQAEILDRVVQVRVVECGYGWYLAAESPFTKETLVIKEDGKFMAYDSK